MKDYDRRIQGIDANDPEAPWNVYYNAAAAQAQKQITLAGEFSVEVPREQWLSQHAPTLFPTGLIEGLCDLVTAGGRIAIIAAPGSGKNTVQYAVHAALSLPSVLAVSAHFDLRRALGKTQFCLSDVAPDVLPDDVRIASWYEMLACGHLFRQFHGAPTICTTSRAVKLSKWWAADRGGLVTIPIPATTAGHAVADLRFCFSEVADLTTHILTIRSTRKFSV